MNTRAADEAAKASQIASFMFLLTVGIFSIIIVLIIISYSLIFCKIKPIDTLVTVADHIAAGDFTRKVELSSKDELGKLATHFNHFIDTVSSVLRESKAAIYDTMNQNSELASTMEQLAGTFQTQTGQVATVASAMEEMSASSAEVNSNINEATGNVDKAMDLTKEGGQLLNSEIAAACSLALRPSLGSLTLVIVQPATLNASPEPPPLLSELQAAANSKRHTTIKHFFIKRSPKTTQLVQPLMRLDSISRKLKPQSYKIINAISCIDSTQILCYL
jgi:HAMP domain-containing protein